MSNAASIAVDTKPIRVALAGVGNCAGSLIEGVYFYKANPGITQGLLFPTIGGYSVSDIEFVIGFDVSALKVGKPIAEAIYANPNNFVRNGVSEIHSPATVYRGPTLDGIPNHLAKYIPESPDAVSDVATLLAQSRADVLLCLLPTGSHEAAKFYAKVAAETNCGFVNCIPSIIAQDTAFEELFKTKGLPLLGDDIKSQLGTTILHRSLLHMLEMRGADLLRTTQINIGGNTDFANFVHRAESKLISKRKSLQRYAEENIHVGHHYDPTQGPLKTALIEIEAQVFGNSTVKISVQLRSDDKPNSAGSICDLVRIAKTALDRNIGGVIDASAFYMKSPPNPMDDLDALKMVIEVWGDTNTSEENLI